VSKQHLPFITNITYGGKIWTVTIAKIFTCSL